MLNRYFRKIDNHPLLLDMLGNPIGFLRNLKDMKIEVIFNDMDIVTFTLYEVGLLDAEQELLFKGKRYIVTRVEETRDSEGLEYTRVECMSAFVELNSDFVPKVAFTNIATQAGAERILRETNWTVEYVEPLPREYLHSMSETGKTALWMIKQFARITGYEIEFDTANRTVSFVVESGVVTDEIARYKKNTKEITRSREPTRATVIIPKGRGGLGIGSVNNGIEYLEDYSWYTDELGIPLAEARKRFRKRYEWNDDRFIYAGALMREGIKKIWQYSRPQISYFVKVFYLGLDQLNVGDYATVIDDNLGIRVSVRVVRIIDYPGEPWKNEIEFNYLIPGLGTAMQDQGGDTEDRTEQTILVKNESAAVVGATYQDLLEMSLTAYASTNLQAGLYIIGQSSEKALLTAYFTFKGVRVGPEVRQVVDGWESIGIPFILSQVQEGSGFLLMFIKIDKGSFSIAKHEAQLYVKGLNLLGGMSSGMPKANIIEEITFPKFNVVEHINAGAQIPIPIAPLKEIIEFPTFEVLEQFKRNFINPGSIIPIMTSNDSPSPYFIVADTSSENHKPFMAFNKYEQDSWKSKLGDITSQISINLGEPKVANYYRITSALINSESPKSWILEGSDEGTVWVGLDEQTNQVFDVLSSVHGLDGIEEREYALIGTEPYQLYRWTFTENNGSTERITTTEIDLIYREDEI